MSNLNVQLEAEGLHSGGGPVCLSVRSMCLTNLDVELEAEEGLDGGGGLGALSVQGAPQLAGEHPADGRVLQLRRPRHLAAVLPDDRLAKHSTHVTAMGQVLQRAV